MRQTIIASLKDKYTKLPMQKKMIYAYSTPVIIVCILVNLYFVNVMNKKYNAQLEYSAGQAYSQASNFVSNHVMNMQYIAQLIAENSVIRENLSEVSHAANREVGEEYREFWRLKDAFADIELSNSMYNIGIYVPDELVYSNNNYYFFPESSLQGRDDYDAIVSAVRGNRMYFAPVDELQYSNNTTIHYVALFSGVKLIDANRNERIYISKVSIPMTDLQTILDQSRSTQNSFAYIVDDHRNVVLSSQDGLSEDWMNADDLPTQIVEPWTQTKLNNRDYYIVQQDITAHNWTLFSLIPKREFRSLSRFIYSSFTITALVSLVVALVSYGLSKYYVGRLSRLNSQMKEVRDGNINATLSLKASESHDEIDEIYANFNFMTDEVRRLLKEHYRLGKNVMSAELRALQAQINPHFLYNTLDIINWGAMDYGATQIAEITRDLGQFYRLGLNKGRSAITIEDELRHVETFVRIENVHFEGAINLTVDASEEIRRYACLNIILQPIVENSIVHGIAGNPEITECNIKIRCLLEGGDICFYIEDDGPGIAEETLINIGNYETSYLDHGYGIKNINFRLNLCYGSRYGITYQSELGVGTQVRMNIPPLSLEELEGLLA